MKKIIIIGILALLNTQFIKGQVDELRTYKNLYRIADSIKKLNKPFTIDSTTLALVSLLDKEHPAKYFEKAIELIGSNKYNEASFIFYLGRLRYQYYNSANPKYEPSGDGALAASLQHVVGETVNLYLKNDFDNFVSVLKYTTDYFKNNDYVFYSKQNSIEKYTKLFDGFDTLINDLIKNKAKYQTEWDNERKMMITNIDKALAKYEKKKPIKKTKVKKKK